ncbi:hypothetical protein ACO2Q3_13090 [Caulobacter sp. KR2-114]|uniref:hypothetical protein n=1 Tax=Caulobacter sp. KR2-114 TaxID=3400912 RepID=UPI003C0E99AE
MRPDMAKILVERPRGGGGRTRHKGRPPRDPDLLRAKLTGRRIAQEAGAAKWLGENLAPLRRYVEQQEGRPWNKVFSEMREHIRPGNTVQEHVFAHLDAYLIRDVEKVSPSPAAPCGLIARDRMGHRGTRPVEERQLYIDPDDGLLKRARRKFKGPRERIAHPGAAPHHLQYIYWAIAVDGVWMRVSLTDYSLHATQMSSGRPEAFLAQGRSHGVWRDPFDGMIYPWEKGRLAVLAKRYGPDRLAYDLAPLSKRQRRLHHLIDARR